MYIRFLKPCFILLHCVVRRNNRNNNSIQVFREQGHPYVCKEQNQFTIRIDTFLKTGIGPQDSS